MPATMSSLNPVRKLPKALANRIAAGEVVERPASVVKELVENSLDAGASSVDIDLERAGLDLIRIRDNGSGMSSHDAQLAVQRHATSKLHQEDDLFAIGTLGFRGEALPSIASVSRFTLITRAEDDAATRIDIEGGSEPQLKQVGFPPGTQVDVRNLFFNTPARKKFLKSDSAELSAVVQVVEDLALAHPAVAFRLTHNGRELLQVASVEDLHERVAGVLGKAAYPHLFYTEQTEGPRRVEGMFSSPDFTKPTFRGMHIFLNRRPIKDRNLQYAVKSAYGTLLEARRFPVVVLLISLPLDDADVNVHPAKWEVRFKDARMIQSMVHHAVRGALQKTPWVQGSQNAVGTRNSEPGIRAAINAYERRRMSLDRLAQAQGSLPIPSGAVLRNQGGFPGAFPAHQASQVQRFDTANQGGSVGDSSKAGGQGAASDSFSTASVGPAAGGYFSSLIVLAQLDKTYLLCQGNDGLVIIDQHAAHERVRFEQLKAQYEKEGVRRQLLLFPMRVELSPNEFPIWQDAREDLERMGFNTEEFGGDSVVIHSVPQMLSGVDAESLLRELLDELAAHDRASSVQDKVERRLMTVACHSSVRAQDVLNTEQIEGLLRQMDQTDMAAHCPHGRPVMIRLTFNELERRFGRTS